MTVNEAIARTDALKPNAVTRDQKVAWLNQLDRLAFNEVILTHEHADGATFEPYTDGTEILIIPEPYDEVYHYYLSMQIDLVGREIDMYNNNKTLYNNAYLTWQDYHNRTVMPLSRVSDYRIKRTRGW